MDFHVRPPYVAVGLRYKSISIISHKVVTACLGHLKYPSQKVQAEQLLGINQSMY